MITPGSHGSTFGGNPLAAAIGREVVAMLQTGEFQARAVALGARLDAGLAPLVGNGFDAVRIRGLWCGIDVTDGVATGRQVTEALLGPRRPRQGGPRPDRPPRPARSSPPRTTSTSSSRRSRP